MNVLVWIIAILLACPASTFAFENIETDSIYNSAIKQEIMSEFAGGLKLLKAQADGLGMPVREKDIKTLQRHMYEKAILIRLCVDRAITLRKTVSDKILSDKNVRECIKEHLIFMDSLHNTKQDYSAKYYITLICANHAVMRRDDLNDSYDFLALNKVEDALVTNYITLRECYKEKGLIAPEPR
jgi:hypothetical protein